MDCRRNAGLQIWTYCYIRMCGFNKRCSIFLEYFKNYSLLNDAQFMYHFYSQECELLHVIKTESKNSQNSISIHFDFVQKKLHEYTQAINISVRFQTFLATQFAIIDTKEVKKIFYHF